MARKTRPVRIKAKKYVDVIDPSIETVGIPFIAALSMLDIGERMLEAIGLFFVYFIFLRQHGRMPTVKELTELGAGSSAKIAAIRKVMKTEGMIKDVFIKRNGKIVARQTHLTLPKFKIPSLGNPRELFIIINNNKLETPAPTASGAVLCSSCNGDSNAPKKNIKKTPREEDFLRFRKAYPKGHTVSKKKDSATWRTNIRDIPPIDILMKALDNAKASDKWTKNNGEYIPLFTTFIHQNRWEEFLDDDQSISTANNEKPRVITREGDPEMFAILCELNRLNTPIDDDRNLHWQPFIPIAEALLEADIDPKELVEWRGREERTAPGHMRRMVPGGDLWDDFMEWRRS